MIEDTELREVFKTASEEHLQKLDEGFLYLEKYPHDLTKLEELLREIHSLKGDAAMLGIKDVSQLAHQLEHLLGEITRGKQIISPETSDRLSLGLDAIYKLVQEAVTGEPSGINTVHVLAILMGANNIKTSLQDQDKIHLKSEKTIAISTSVKEQKVAKNTSSPNTQQPEEVAKINESSFTKTEPDENTLTSETPDISSSYHIETVRVSTRNLDFLMTQTGELNVTQIRLFHRLAEIEKITNLWEEWSRDILKNCFLVSGLNVNDHTTINNSTQQFQNYYLQTEERLENLGLLINNLRNSIHEDIAKLDLISRNIGTGVRTLRMLPLSTIFNIFPRVVRDLARQEGKEVKLIIEGGESKADKRIIEQMKDPLIHLIRNAIDHGIETPTERKKSGKNSVATIKLRAENTASQVIIEVIDDGRGLDIEKIKQTAVKQKICSQTELASMTQTEIQSMIFTPGFSTKKFVTEISGRGIGLDVVKANVEELKGNIHIESQLGKGCLIRVILSTSIATINVLIVAVANIYYALPIECVKTTLLVSIESIFTIEGRDTIIFDNEPVSVFPLSDLLNFSAIERDEINEIQENNCIIIQIGNEKLGLFVDDLIDVQNVMLKPQSKLLKRVINVSGATILGTGDVCMILNPQDLMKSAKKLSTSIFSSKFVQQLKVEKVNKKSLILLVEDSIATRTQEKRILENAGYEVITAVDGIDALNKLKIRSFDAVISDIQMPNMDGLTLTTKIRENQNYAELPIILVTSLASHEDKQKGAEVGASAYITKDSFNQEVLLETLKRLV
ncbi:hybrid sensor histidine kinase/response regulator [Okeania sp. KiyG1]|uniref:hybrid sensor histidine kinase/response regulator n=1 Tax=Okeania sp. KiyG1 TaxID=2720165 RepID=UPI0019208A78|nr:hybrid sensor histidine kinase/response regulator [Okeania sp. KiyG1]GGA50280.1 transcriptional regulator [Okeania sp. KiyG1]